jgi:hypothetical protein
VEFHASDGLPHAGVSAITSRTALSRGDGRNDRQALIRIVDAKIRTRPLCPAGLFGGDGRTLSTVFRADPFLYYKP